MGTEPLLTQDVVAVASEDTGNRCTELGVALRQFSYAGHSCGGGVFVAARQDEGMGHALEQIGEPVQETTLPSRVWILR